MSTHDDRPLAELIRVVNPVAFSADAHGPGDQLIYDSRHKTVLAKLGLAENLIRRKEEFTHYYVKRLGKPTDPVEWRFRWADAARAIDLDLKASIQVEVRNTEEARALVAALHSPKGPDQALHACVDSALHARLSERAGQNGNLLDEFLPASRGVEQGLDKAVSRAVSDHVGARVMVRFTLASDAPRQLEIEAHRTDFKASDTSTLHRVLTSAQLELESYQAFRQSGLSDRDEVEQALRKATDNAIKKHLFGRPYYEITAAFDRSTDESRAIKDLIHDEIRQQARLWGYGVRMFHTLPDIKALSLASGVRVDVFGREYRTRNSMGVVKMDVSVLLTAQDYGKLAKLIPPDHGNMQEKLSEALYEVCRDQVLKIDRKRFNLEFDAAPEERTSVKDLLTEALSQVFATRHGLRVSVIDIVQQQTEEGERFENIHRRAWPFMLEVTARANAGTRDVVFIDGEFEVVAMHPDGWDKFESKDFGYRRSSVRWTPSRWAEFSRQFEGRATALSEAERELERKAAAVDEELKAIAGRIVSLLQGALKSLPDLALRSRDYRQQVHLQQRATELVQAKVADEFGLQIELRKFERRDTDTEHSNRLIHTAKHAAIRQRAPEDAEHALQMSNMLRSKNANNLERLLARKADLRDRDDSDASRQEEEAALDAEIAKLTGTTHWGAVSEDTLANFLDEGEPGATPAALLGDELSDTPRRARRKMLR